MSVLLLQITCPGVLLKDKQELYLNVFVLGQYSKTECVPAVFPLFFQERLVFEKVRYVKVDTAVLELIQLVPPVGKVLATYEENTRDFLFPDPKLTHGRRGLEREVLMKRSPSFTGIAPKLRFSTISIISDSLLSLGRSHIQADTNLLDSTLNGKMQSKVPKKSPPPAEKGRQSSAVKGYEQPTIASKSRSPSPYTKRRMCELSEEARQRLAHLNLGPHEFRRDTDKPPFVIRRVGIRSKVGKGLDSSAVCKEDVSLDPPNSVSHSAASLEHLAPPAAQEPSLRTSPSRTSSSSVLNRSSLRERFSTVWPSPANGDEIHKRVKNILRTHSARQRLIFVSLTKGKLDLFRSLCQDQNKELQNPPVHLDNGECWPGPAAVYKEKPHRAILEETLAKIYKNMYQKTAGAVSEHKTHS
uniref:Spermatogenesis associated 6 n=1 Tax=Catharus ustulatus TaxID=91951 RepID=A0A8C3TT98_CATUS